LRYGTGAGRLFAGEHLVVLVTDRTGPAVVDQLWAAVRAGDSTGAAASVLSADLEQAVILAFDDTAIRVLLRGDVELAEPVEHSGRGAIAFREFDLQPGNVVARLGSSTGPCDLPLDAGVVGAEAFEWSVSDVPLTDQRHGGSAEQQHTLAVIDVPSEWPTTDAVSDRGSVDAASSEPVDSADHEEAATADDLARTLSSAELERLDGDAAAAVEAAVDELADAPVADSYDRLFGATSLFMPPGPVSPDMPRAEETAVAADVDEKSPAIPPAAPTDKADAPRAVMSDEPIVARPGDGGLIDGVPTFLLAIGSATAAPRPLAPPPAVVPTGPVAPQPVEQSDVSELTLARPPMGAPAAVQTLIQAVHCPHGHPNPAESVTCRLCGAEVPSQSAVTVPRPLLGALVGVDVPEGAPALIELDRSLVLGRKPFVDEVTSSVPRLVVVDSPDGGISRQHAKVVLDGWHVLVADLGSRYGTVVQLPAEDPVLLHPNSPVMITPGTTVTLAEVVTYRFQAQP
jgi:hypothetical protein